MSTRENIRLIARTPLSMCVKHFFSTDELLGQPTQLQGIWAGLQVQLN